MKEEVKEEVTTVKDFLKDVQEDQCFRLEDGRILKNLNDLVDTLKTIDDTLFNSHVNESKNDFSSWIQNCINDELLASMTSKIKSKQEMENLVSRRIQQLNIQNSISPQMPKKQPSEEQTPIILQNTDPEIDSDLFGDDSPKQEIKPIIAEKQKIDLPKFDLSNSDLDLDLLGNDEPETAKTEVKPINQELLESIKQKEESNKPIIDEIRTETAKIIAPIIIQKPIQPPIQSIQQTVQQPVSQQIQPPTPQQIQPQILQPIQQPISQTTQKTAKDEPLDPRALFKRLKELKQNQSQLQNDINQKTISPPEIKNIIVSQQIIEEKPKEKKLEELNPRELFKRLKEQKANPATPKTSSQTEQIEQQIKETQIINKIAQKPLDLLNLNDEEFHKLIGINPNDEFVALPFTEQIVKAKKLRRLKTGVPGFDEMIEGGIPEYGVILVSGGPGTGKTTFSIQQLGWAAEHGEKCLFMSFEEDENVLIEHMESYGLNPKKYLKNGNLQIKKLDSFKMSRQVETLLAKARGELIIDYDPVAEVIPSNYIPDRVVLDSLSAIAATFGEQKEAYRIYVEQLFKIFKRLKVTAFVITEIQGSESSGHGGVEDFVADGVIAFYNMRKGNERQPAVEILKMRGTKHKKKVVPFGFISGKGLEIYPLEEVFMGNYGGR